MRISGSIYHNIAAVHPDPGEQAKFLQCFFHDSNVNNCDKFHFSPIETAVYCKTYHKIQQFSPFLTDLHFDNYPNPHIYRVVISVLPPPNTDNRTVNQPSAIIVGNG